MCYGWAVLSSIFVLVFLSTESWLLITFCLCCLIIIDSVYRADVVDVLIIIYRYVILFLKISYSILKSLYSFIIIRLILLKVVLLYGISIDVLLACILALDCLYSIVVRRNAFIKASINFFIFINSKSINSLNILPAIWDLLEPECFDKDIIIVKIILILIKARSILVSIGFIGG